MSEVVNLPAGARERLAQVAMPTRIRHLPRDSRGYPIPAFVETVNGKPDFRIMKGSHLRNCITRKVCWVCGDKLGRFLTFVVGPMCIVNRTSAEPPSHHECGYYAVRVCPFMVIPEMRRIDHDIPEDATVSGGIGIRRNPGVACLWTTRSYSVISANGLVFRMAEPTSVEWYAHGRMATRSEVLESMDSGYPILMNMAQEEGEEAVKELAAMRSTAMTYIPQETKEDRDV